MGDKPTRKRKCFLLYLAGCLTVSFLVGGCAAPYRQPPVDRDPKIIAARHLSTGKCQLMQGDYETARKEAETVLALYSDSMEDQALYLLGMVLIHPDNPGQDTQRALDCFQRIVNLYPNSELAADASTWIAVIAQLEANKRLVENLENASSVLEQKLKAEKRKRISLEERLQQMKAIDLTTE